MRKTNQVLLAMILLGAIALGHPVQAQQTGTDTLGPDRPLVTTPAPPAVTAAELVVEVVVNGLKNTPPEVQQKVRAIVGQLKGKKYDDTAIDKAIYAIDDTGYFWGLLARPVTREDTAAGIRLTFDLSENQVVTGIDIEGNTVFNAAELLKLVKTQVGQPMYFPQMNADADALDKYFIEHGYTLNRITHTGQDPLTGRVSFKIFECIISKIIITGNYKTKDYVIKREMKMKVGEVYNQKKVIETLNALRRMSIFQDVEIKDVSGEEPGTINLLFNVIEQMTGTGSGGITTGSNAKPLLYLSVSDTNFLGSNQSIGLMGSFGEKTSYRFNYANPWLNDRQTSGSVSLYSIINPRDLKNSAGSFSYDEHRTGLNLTVGQPVDQTTHEYFTFRADHIYGSSTNTDPLLDPVKASTNVRSLGYSQVRDVRDSAFNPTKGYYGMGSIEVAGFGGNSFTKVQAEGRYYYKVKPGKVGKTRAETKQPWVYAAHLTMGLIKGDAPYLDQFLAGGTNTNTIRGYSDDSFPGKAMFVFNSELRVPLNETLQGVGFLDIGDAFGGSFAANFGDADARVRLGYGIGLRLNSPIGPIRLDWGFNPSGQNRIHFGMGATY